MKFLTKFIKEHRTLSLTVLVGALLVASGIYLATIQIQAVPPDPTWEWAKKVGAAGGDDRSKTVARDDAGNVYVAGEFDGPIIFAGAPACMTVLTPAGTDIYIAKYDDMGSCIWVTSVGGPNNDFVNDIAVYSPSGADGQIYITGSFIDNLVLDSFTLSDADSSGSAFIARLNFTDDPLTFTWVWADSLDSSGSSSNAGNALMLYPTTSPPADVYLTGHFRGSISLLDGGNVDIGGPAIPSAGGDDIFVAKLDSGTGALSWSAIETVSGPSDDDRGLGIDVDSSGDAYVSGFFIDSTTFDLGGGNETILTSQGLGDGFVAKYADADGSLVWARPLGGDDGSFFDQASDIKIGSDGNVNITGLFAGDATTDYTNPILGAATNFVTGGSPRSVAMGDFNGDLELDLVVANFGDDDVSILLGVGDGTFGAAANFAVGTNPLSVAVGYLNADGNLDLAVANQISNNVSVLLGVGDGTFGAAANFAVGTNPGSVVVEDFNGDLVSDLAVTDYGFGNISILLGVGDGTFGAAANFAVGSGPGSVAVGYFDADGNLDLAVANQISNDVSVLLGVGDGTFGAATNLATNPGSVSVAIEDFNGDTNLDLAVANLSGDNVSILLGVGDGTFGAATNFAVVVGASPISVAVEDLNADGNLDLAVANFSDDNVSVLLGAGDGTFGAATNFAVGIGPRYVATGDFDADGNPDLAVTNQDSDNVSILLGDNGPGFLNLGLTAVSDVDIFVTQLDPVAGALNWARRGGRNSDTSPSLTLNATDSVYVAGDFNGGSLLEPATFDNDEPNDPDPIIGSSPIAGSNDVLVFGYDNLGNFLWSQSAGGTLADYANDITFFNPGVDPLDDAWYVTGFYVSDPATFATPTPTDLALSGVIDGFLAKLKSIPLLPIPPTLSSSFAPSSGSTPITSTLSITMANTNIGTASMIPPPVTVTLPAGMVVAPLPATSFAPLGCGSFVTPPMPGETSFIIDSASIPGSDTCVVSVDVTPSATGTITISDLFTDAGGSSSDPAPATFTVVPPGGGPPTVTTLEATDVTKDSATLNGEWIGTGAGTSYFDWNIKTDSNPTCSTQSLGTSTTPVNLTAGTHGMSEPISSLLAGRTYCFRAVGTNIAPPFTTNGDILSFTTSRPGASGGYEPIPVPGVCGRAGGGTFEVAPQTYLCAPDDNPKGGKPTAVTGPNGAAPGTWNWQCQGSNGGASLSCSANVSPQKPVCGSANGGKFITAPTKASLCKEGAASNVSGPTNGYWNWLCYIPGSNPVVQVNCSAIAPLSPPIPVCAGSLSDPLYQDKCDCQQDPKLDMCLPPPPPRDPLDPPELVCAGSSCETPLPPPIPLFLYDTALEAPTPYFPDDSLRLGDDQPSDGAPRTGQGTPSDFVSGFLNSVLPSGVVSQITDALNTPAGNVVANILITLGVVLGAVTAAAQAFFISQIVLSDVPLLPLRLWSALLAFLGVKKELKWGTVFSSATQEKLDPVYVALMDSFGKEVATGITDLEGRYGFPIQKIGTYTMTAGKGGYDAFPSKKLAEQTETSLFKDLYFGGPIVIKEEGQIITRNIPLDPLNFDWNQMQKEKLGYMKSHVGREKLIALISRFFFGVGFIVATLTLIFAPKPFNIAIFALYIVLLVLRRFSILKAKKKGKIIKNGMPLPFSILRVYQASVPDVEIAHSVANRDGSFYRLIPNGRYIVKIDEMASEGVYNSIFTSQPFEVKNGIIAGEFAI